MAIEQAATAGQPLLSLCRSDFPGPARLPQLWLARDSHRGIRRSRHAVDVDNSDIYAQAALPQQATTKWLPAW